MKYKPDQLIEFDKIIKKQTMNKTLSKEQWEEANGVKEAISAQGAWVEEKGSKLVAAKGLLYSNDEFNTCRENHAIISKDLVTETGSSSQDLVDIQFRSIVLDEDTKTDDEENSMKLDLAVKAAPQNQKKEAPKTLGTLVTKFEKSSYPNQSETKSLKSDVVGLVFSGNTTGKENLTLTADANNGSQRESIVLRVIINGQMLPLVIHKDDRYSIIPGLVYRFRKAIFRRFTFIKNDDVYADITRPKKPTEDDDILRRGDKGVYTILSLAVSKRPNIRLVDWATTWSMKVTYGNLIVYGEKTKYRDEYDLPIIRVEAFKGCKDKRRSPHDERVDNGKIQVKRFRKGSIRQKTWQKIILEVDADDAIQHVAARIITQEGSIFEQSYGSHLYDSSFSISVGVNSGPHEGCAVRQDRKDQFFLKKCKKEYEPEPKKEFSDSAFALLEADGVMDQELSNESLTKYFVYSDHVRAMAKKKAKSKNNKQRGKSRRDENYKNYKGNNNTKQSDYFNSYVNQAKEATKGENAHRRDSVGRGGYKSNPGRGGRDHTRKRERSYNKYGRDNDQEKKLDELERQINQFRTTMNNKDQRHKG